MVNYRVYTQPSQHSWAQCQMTKNVHNFEKKCSTLVPKSKFRAVVDFDTHHKLYLNTNIIWSRIDHRMVTHWLGIFWLLFLGAVCNRKSCLHAAGSSLTDWISNINFRFYDFYAFSKCSPGQLQMFDQRRFRRSLHFFKRNSNVSCPNPFSN